jgi:hypothetical protein
MKPIHLDRHLFLPLISMAFSWRVHQKRLGKINQLDSTISLAPKTIAFPSTPSGRYGKLQFGSHVKWLPTV